MSMNVNGAGAVTTLNIQGMDLETALLAVQSQRANLLEDQLKGQIEAVQKKNAQIAQLNTAMAALNGVKGLYGGESKATTKMSDTQNKKNGNNTLEKVQQAQNNANNALKAAGYEGGMTELGTSKYGTNVQGDTTMGQVDAAIQQLKAQIDSLSNSQQMDMLRLQSLSNKRNEAFETMTNFIKKMQDSRSSIIGNMR